MRDLGLICLQKKRKIIFSIDSLGFKNPILNFLKETHPEVLHVFKSITKKETRLKLKLQFCPNVPQNERKKLIHSPKNSNKTVYSGAPAVRRAAKRCTIIIKIQNHMYP